MTLNSSDVAVRDVNLESQAQQIANRIETGLEKAKSERQPVFLLKQAKLSAVVLLLMVLSNFVLLRWSKRPNQR